MENIQPAQPGVGPFSGVHWGWNPLSDIQQGASSLGQYINQKTSIGGINLGLGSLATFGANALSGIANLAYNAGKDVVTGDGGALSSLLSQAGGGLEHGALDTVTDIATLGGTMPYRSNVEQALHNAFGYTPVSLVQHGQQHDSEGLLGGALNDVLNLTLAGDGAAKLASVGDIGEGAQAAIEAEQAAQAKAIDAGAQASDVMSAGADAREAAIQSNPDIADAVRQRAQFLDRMESMKSGVQTMINPLHLLRPLGMAASEVLAPGEATAPDALESPVGPSEGQPEGIAAKAEPGPTPPPEAEPIPKPQTGEAVWHGPVGDIPINVEGELGADSAGNRYYKITGSQTGIRADEVEFPHEPAQPIQPSEGVAAIKKFPEAVPSAYKSFIQRAAGAPDWARTIVRYLPKPMQRLLATVDSMTLAHEYKVIRRQNQVYVNVVARQVENSPEIMAVKEAAIDLLRRRIPHLTPLEASRIVGERVHAALTLGPLWDDIEENRAALDADHPGLTDHLLGFAQRVNEDGTTEPLLPDEFNTQEFRDSIHAISDPIRAARQAEEERMKQSVFLGERGLENNGNGVLMTDKEQALADQIRKLSKEAALKDAEGHDAAFQRLSELMADQEEAERDTARPSEKGEDLRARADQVEARGADQAHAILTELYAQHAQVLRDADVPSDEGVQLRQNADNVESSGRAEAEVQLHQLQVERANALETLRTPDPNVEPMRQLAADEEARGNTVRAESLRQRADQLEQAKLIQDGIEAARANRAVNDLRTQIDDRQLESDNQSAQMREQADAADRVKRSDKITQAIDYAKKIKDIEDGMEQHHMPYEIQAAHLRLEAEAAERRDMILKGIRVITAKRAVTDLQKAIEDRLLPENEIADKIREKMQTKTEKLAQKLSEAPKSRVAAKWHPFIEAADRIAAAAEQYPELEPILEAWPRQFGDALDYAAAHGFDPVYMPDLTPGRVRQLINGTATLGGEAGKQFISGARKTRTGYLAANDLADRSIESLIAGFVQATQEDRANSVVHWIDTVASRPVGPGGIIPEGGTAWDPIRRGMLATEHPVTGEEVAVGATRWIPTSVAKAIQEYSNNVQNPIYRTLEKVTNPWRFFMLTLNPAFYLRHMTGHIMLAAIAEGGFHLSDWVQAYQSMRNGFKDLPQVTGQNITIAELGQPGVVQYPDVRTAYEQGGAKAAIDFMVNKPHGVIATSDSFARAVDYFARKREGYSDMEALQHANTALVDYQNLSPTEKYMVRSVIPFYGFQKGILKIVLNMPIEHPLATAVLLHLGQFQEEAAKDPNGNPLPSNYQGVVNLFGHNVNLTGLSPFKDLGALTTPAGLTNQLQFALAAVVRSGLNAPAPYTNAGLQVNPYGQLVPRVTVASQLFNTLSSSPQGVDIGAAMGKGPLAALSRSIGLPTVGAATLGKAGARNVLSTGELLNMTPLQQEQATQFPVDTRLAQQALEQAPSPLTPGANAPQQITQQQIATALAAQQQKQAQAAAATKARGMTKAGILVKHKGTSSHRGGRRTSASTFRFRSGVRTGGHKVSLHTRASLRQSFGKAHNHAAKQQRIGSGGAGKIVAKGAGRGVAGMKKKHKI